MSDTNKAILQKANAAIDRGDNEGFLAFCADDIVWTEVGETSLKGKDAVRQMMAKDYTGPPHYTVELLVAEGEFVTAVGAIMARGKSGESVWHRYCDVWRFRDGLMVDLQAFVVEIDS